MLAVCLMCLADLAVGQMSGTKYAITSGSVAGGGGQSASGKHGLNGTIPLTGAGLSATSKFAVSGGFIGITPTSPGFLPMYAADTVEVVTIADKLLTVTHNGDPAQVSGLFYSRLGGETAYQPVDMATGTGNTLQYPVPAGRFGTRGLEYYFVISDGSSNISIGSPSRPYAFVTDLSNAQAQRPTSLERGKYRIVGVPLNVSGPNTVISVFEDDFGPYDKTKWRLGSYNGETGTVVEYPSAARVKPGQGYWLIMRDPSSYGADALSMRPDRFEAGAWYYQLALDSGWNQVANPFAFSVAWSQVRFLENDVFVTGHPADILDDAAYYYNGSTYISASTIPAWDGVFIFIKKPNIAILFPFRQASAGAPKASDPIAELPSADNWDIQFVLTADGLTDAGNLAGVRYDARRGDDNYDYTEPPPAPGAACLAFRLPEGDPRLRCIDFRPPFVDGAEWQLAISPASGRLIEVTGIADIPAGMEALLILDNNVSVRLSDDSRIMLPDAVASARLIIGTEKYLAGETEPTLPASYELEQNYPNPFNPFTSIPFALPEPQRVELVVYNILGQRIKTLVEDYLEAGTYVENWDGTNDKGTAAASGIYFYRLAAGSFSQSRKMVLLK